LRPFKLRSEMIAEYDSVDTCAPMAGEPKRTLPVA
jgi:hypothetical protein